MPDDPSIMTYKGHRIAKSLIRAKFSPLENTGQRFIYTGCGTGRVVSKYLFLYNFVDADGLSGRALLALIIKNNSCT